jgi:hypothetical protein
MRKDSKKTSVVLVRTYSAGVHVGTPVGKLKGRELTLKNAHRIWRWRGANTLHELSQQGAHETEFTRISEPVPSLTLTEAIEVIPCSPVAAKNLTRPRWLA